MARINVRVTDSLEKVFKVRNGMTVGRDPKNHIQLLAKPISRNHAQFIVIEDRVNIVDLGSSNGTKVNGQRITEVELNDGDVIDIGGVIMTYQKEVVHVADENIFVLETTDMPREQVATIANRSELGMVLPSTAEMIDLAYNISRSYLEHVGLPEDNNVNVLTALYEAMDNAKRHGNIGDVSKKIRLFFMSLPDRLNLAVVDEGQGFDYASILEKSLEQDALTAARERYMAGGMGGLGIRLMLKCVDKIEYEQEGAKIVLTKFKEPLAAQEAGGKELTTEEQVYKNTLWEEMQKSEKEKTSEPQESFDHADAVLTDEPKTEPLPKLPSQKSQKTTGQSSDRPEERVKRFEDRLSQFFFLDGKEGIRELKGKNPLSEIKNNEEEQTETGSSKLQINMPEYLHADEQETAEKDDLDLEL